MFGNDTIKGFNSSEDKIDLSKLTEASVSAKETGNGVQLTVASEPHSPNGTITLEGMNMENWNAIDQESILLINTIL